MIKLVQVSSFYGNRPPGIEGGRGGEGGMGSGEGGMLSPPLGLHESWVKKAMLLRAASTLWWDLREAVCGSASKWFERTATWADALQKSAASTANDVVTFLIQSMIYIEVRRVTFIRLSVTIIGNLNCIEKIYLPCYTQFYSNSFSSIYLLSYNYSLHFLATPS